MQGLENAEKATACMAIVLAITDFIYFCVEKQSLHQKYHIELSPPECDNIVANASTCV